MKLENVFPIKSGGKETTATILGIYVYEEDIYMPVIIAATDKLEVFQILPNGIKMASRKLVDEFAQVIFAEEKSGSGE